MSQLLLKFHVQADSDTNCLTNYNLSQCLVAHYRRKLKHFSDLAVVYFERLHHSYCDFWSLLILRYIAYLCHPRRSNVHWILNIHKQSMHSVQYEQALGLLRETYMRSNNWLKQHCRLDSEYFHRSNQVYIFHSRRYLKRSLRINKLQFSNISSKFNCLFDFNSKLKFRIRPVPIFLESRRRSCIQYIGSCLVFDSVELLSNCISHFFLR